MSASGINWRYRRDEFIRAGICPCDPVAGDSCRHCDGGGSYHADLAAIAAAVAAVEAREQARNPQERRSVS